MLFDRIAQMLAGDYVHPLTILHKL
jgi:hypothetical protein